jgi:hypothetical protein
MNWNDLTKKTDFWIEQNLNVLLIGEHGIGKTAIIKDAFERNKLKWRYFSASTMDPWVDFVGVPKEVQGENGSSYLDLIQKQEFQDGSIEMLFFDEFNRAPDKVRNAVMELIQFRSINGRKLPNLKGVWAAINPYDENETYDVEELDPAQEDRFHIIYELPNEPNKQYFQEKFGARMGTRAVEWWHYLPDNLKRLVSPRRLDYAVDIYTKGGDLEDVLRDEVRPKTLRRKIETIDTTTTHADKWLKDGDAYLAEVADRKSNIDVVAAFDELQDISMDQAVAYLTQLPSNKLNSLATSVKTIGVLLRHAAHIQPSNRKVMTALTKNRMDGFMLLHDRFSEIESSDRELWVLAKGCESGNEEAWKTMVLYVQQNVANEELSYSACELIMLLCVNAGRNDQTREIGNLLIHYVEEYYQINLVQFVQANPSFIIDVYN